VALVLAVAGASMWLASPARAQRYRVLVSEEGSTRVSVVDFRPCVPAETSDCGAWLDRVYDAALDSTAMRPTRRLTQIVSERAGVSVAIRGGTVVVTSVSPANAKPVIVSGTHGTPLALELAGDGAYAFAIVEGAANRSPELEMIDLNTNSVWAVFPLKARPAAIAMAP
jgi:hypothetical protein